MVGKTGYVWALLGLACMTGHARGGGVPGDDCATCIPVATDQIFFGSTVSATGQTPSSCGGSAEMWHCWTADCDGLATFSLCGEQTDFDTVVSVFDTCNGAEVFCNDDACPGSNTLASQAEFLVRAGTPYRIRIAGLLGATGSYQLQVTCTPGPANDQCRDASPISVGTTPFSTINASSRTSPLPGFCDEGFGSDIDRDIWYDYTANCTGIATFSTCNDATFDTRLAAYAGCACPVDSADVAGCNDDGSGCTGFTSTLRIEVEEGACYKIRLGGFSDQTGTGSLTVDCRSLPAACVGSTEFCVAAHATPGCMDPICCDTVCAQDSFCCEQTWDASCVNRANVFCLTAPNDNCEDAAIETLPHTFTGNNVTATHQCDRFDGNHVWIAFEVDAVSDVTLDYCGTTPMFGSAWLNLALGCPCEENTALAGACFLCPDGNVQLKWSCLSPGVYYYPVLSLPGAQGDYTIHVQADPCANPDQCADAVAIADGRTLFDTLSASTDGPPLLAGCDWGAGTDIRKDIWFDYTASCTGIATFDACGSPIFTSRMALYTGDACPVDNDRLIACDNGAQGCSSPVPALIAGVTAGERYKLRVGSPNGDVGGGCVEVTCVPDDPICPSGPVAFLDPPDGVVDARQPFPLGGGTLQGISTLVLEAPTGAPASCFILCETAVDGSGSNAIIDVTEQPTGTYTLGLARAITPGAVTTIRYLGDGDFVGHFISHPANANGDSAAAPTDILHIIDFLNGVTAPPWGLYSTDMDHNGGFAPPDILRLIDLLNGAEAFDPWNGTAKPTPDGLCP